MRKTLLFFGILIILFGSGMLSLGILKNSTGSQEVEGEETEGALVKDVIDGDTLSLTDGRTVRLIGINAPEKGQPYYNESKLQLENLIKDAGLDVQFDVEKLDKYGRTLAYIYSKNLFANKELIKAGLAVTETIPPNVSYSQDFVKAQEDARTNCRGIWEGLCSQTASACVQISAVNKGSYSDLNSEWIELINTCADSYEMRGALVKDNSASNSYVFKDFKLGPKQKVRLYSGCFKDSQNSLYWQCPERNTAVWNNDGDSAYLFDASGKLISEVSY